MSRPHRKTTILWNDPRYREVELDLQRFKARAVGSRLRQLALLGLLAEAVGFRIEDTVEGPRLAGGQPVMLAPAAGLSTVADQPGAPSVDQRVEPPDPRALDFSSQFLG